jgi:cyclophilin family peptidyl-prolyl cis-trans isomerase
LHALRVQGRGVRAALLLLLSLAACRSSRSVRRDAATAAPSRAAAEARALLLRPDDAYWQQPAPSTFVVRIESSQGVIRVAFERALAPRGVDRVYQLVRAGFFDDSRFSRVVPGFIAQFGVPGDPPLGAVWRSRAIPDDSVRASNVRGAIAFAMTGPDTRTHQLFISLVDNSRLDAQGFAPLGRVIEGMDVVDRLYGGYGETSGGGMRGGRQGRVFAEGNRFLDAEFPRLDRLIRARVEP